MEPLELNIATIRNAKVSFSMKDRNMVVKFLTTDLNLIDMLREIPEQHLNWALEHMGYTQKPLANEETKDSPKMVEPMEDVLELTVEQRLEMAYADLKEKQKTIDELERQQAESTAAKDTTEEKKSDQTEKPQVIQDMQGCIDNQKKKIDRLEKERDREKEKMALAIEKLQKQLTDLQQKFQNVSEKKNSLDAKMQSYKRGLILERISKNYLKRALDQRDIQFEEEMRAYINKQKENQGIQDNYLQVAYDDIVANGLEGMNISSSEEG